MGLLHVAAGGAASSSDLELRLLSEPLTLFAVLALKLLPAALGLVLLVLWWMRRRNVRAGFLPAPARVEATVPIQPAPAYLLAVLGMVLLPWLIGSAIVSARGGAASGDAEASALESAPLWVNTAAMAAGTLLVAGFVLWRRHWMQAATPAARAAWFPVRTPDPTQPPGPAGALRWGAWGYCVAVCLMVPVSIVWVLLVRQVGLGDEAQDLVMRVIEPEAAYEPWVIVVFGVVIAPLTEETLFRGMLYPATKRAFGDTRRAAWGAAVLVSLLFAAIHGNWAAALPLFVLAMVLTWVMERTNSLLACVLIHAANNGFALVPLLLLGSGS